MIEVAQIQVKFFSKKVTLPDIPLRVPGNLKRTGLSEVINHLLSSANKVPYDFLINGKILACSLVEYLEKSGLSTENTLSIEVIESIPPPKRQNEHVHDDWISSIDYKDGVLLCGCYDGFARVYGKVAISAENGKPVKSVAFNNFGTGFVSGSLDFNLKYFEISQNNCSLQWEGLGHTKSIQTVLCTEEYFVSGSYDRDIMFWSQDPTEDYIIKKDSESQPSKRRKTAGDEKVVHKVRPVFALNGHADAVTCLTQTSATNLIFSGGLDNSVRCWDIENKFNKQTMGCDHAVLCLDGNIVNNTVAVGHTDGSIRIWDPRTSEKANELVSKVLTGHNNWVTSISWSPDSEHQLASASFDGLMKVWDTRSTNALYTLRPKEAQRLFSVKWTDDGKLICGGESGKVQIYSASGHANEAVNDNE